ncbi:MAG: hypothetical protein Q9160_002785 [Pyrenula sp. 1 TL-2023]
MAISLLLPTSKQTALMPLRLPAAGKVTIVYAVDSATPSAEDLCTVEVAPIRIGALGALHIVSILKINTDGTYCCEIGGASCNSPAFSATQTVTSVVTSATGASAAATSQSVPSSSSCDNNSNVAAVAAGIAVPLGLLFIASSMLFLWQFRQNRARSNDDHQHRWSMDKSEKSWHNNFFGTKSPSTTQYKSVEQLQQKPEQQQQQPPQSSGGFAPKPELDGRETTTTPHELSAK